MLVSYPAISPCRYFNDHPFPVNGTAMQTTAPEVE